MRRKKEAMITFNSDSKQWVLKLLIDGNYEFSKAWNADNEAGDGYAWVHDSIICEIARLQDLGYNVRVLL